MKELSCCFTGYRPEKFPFSLTKESKEKNMFENKLYDAVFSLPSEGVTRFYSGMAMGFDIVAAETVLNLRETIKNTSIELIAIVPFVGQADNFPKEWRARYDKILAAADKVIILSEKYFNGCFSKRNCYMIDKSDIVLTYYDGQTGGTKSTLNYASRKKKRIVNIAEYGVHEFFEEDEQYYIFDNEEDIKG